MKEWTWNEAVDTITKTLVNTDFARETAMTTEEAEEIAELIAKALEKAS